MGRRKRNKKQNCEASAPDQFHNEAQQGDPIDQEQVILPDPEVQNDPEPNPQKEEIHLDPPDDPAFNPSQEEQGTHQDLQDDPEQYQEQEEVHQNLQKHTEQEDVYQEPVVEQRVPQALIVDVKEQQEIRIAELDSEDQHKEIVPLSQEIFERETEPATVTSRNSLENPEQKVEILVVPTTLEESQETEETRAGVTPVSQKSAETRVQTPVMVPPILQESPSQEVEIQAVPINLDGEETEVKTQIGVPPFSQESAESEVERQAVVVSPVLQQSSAQDVETQARANSGSHGGSEQEIEIVPSENLQRNELSIHSEREIDENEEQKQLHFIDPYFADPRKLINLVESEDAELSSPDELEFPDPRELLKDLNFVEMKANNEETKLVGKLKQETVVNLQAEDDEDLKTEVSAYTISENSGNSETEAREVLKTETERDLKTEVDKNLEAEVETEEDENSEMKNHEDLELDNHGRVEAEVCRPLRPSTARLSPADENRTPDDQEDSSNESLPSDKGNSEGSRNECTRERQEEPNKNGDPYFGLSIVIGCTLLFISFIILFITSLAKRIVSTKGKNSQL